MGERDQPAVEQAPVRNAPDIVRCPACRTPYRRNGLAPTTSLRCTTCAAVFMAGAPGTPTPAAPSPILDQQPARSETREPTPTSLGQQPTMHPPSSSAGQGGSSSQPSVLPQTVDQVLRLASGSEKYGEAEEIARGGMGVILKVDDLAMRRDVAMKVMRHDSNALQSARFIEEAQITGQLEHPNIVPIHEIGLNRRGRIFFTMKLVKGKSLAALLEEMRNDDHLSDREHSLRHLLTVFLSICNAVAFAHSRGVVHRDLKPANIMLGDYGEVMVMDWGLARVGVARRSITEDDDDHIVEEDEDPQIRERVSSFLNDSESERTIEGVISGTPVYMSPEQARGNIASIDGRSDVYSLGAILYEMLSLEQPVRGKDVEDILKKVRAGDIRPPGKVAGRHQVPMELSAVSMKALATSPKMRYQTVEGLIRDVELYLEGRSVSAKEDTQWEILVKLIKRNRTTSVVAAAGLAALLLVGSIFIDVILSGKYQAEALLATIRYQQKTTQVERSKSAPAWYGKSQGDIDHKDFTRAGEDVEEALDRDAGLMRAYKLRAKLKIRNGAYAAASKDLQRYLDSPEGTNDVNAQQLMTLCRETSGSRSDDSRTIHLFAEAFLSQHEVAFAESMMSSAGDRLRIYRARLEHAWPGTGGDLTACADGTCTLVITNHVLDDLAPLAGIPISCLDLSACRILDLHALSGMPLTDVRLGDTHVRDITPLAGMPITHLVLSRAEITSISVLTGMPMVSLDLSDVPVSDLTPLANMKLTTLDLSGTKITTGALSVLANMPLMDLRLGKLPVDDVRVLSHLPLRSLHLDHTLVTDLSPLREMPLHALYLDGTPIFDISPLEGLPLNELSATSTPLADINELNGLPLNDLDLSGSKITHLAPLAGMKLTRLRIARTHITDLSPLLGQPLSELDLDGTPVFDLSPLHDMPLHSLVLSGTQVTNVSGLRNLPLEFLVLPPLANITGVEALRQIHSLREIDVEGDARAHADAASFWSAFDRNHHGR